MRSAPPALLLALPLCVACAGAVPAAGCTGPAAVQEVVWERDCTGCPEGLRLRFGRDGRALLTVTGKSRFRTQDRERPATLAPGDFERLAAALAEAGLFGLAAVHEPADVADGRWTRWQASCATTTHEVFRREDAGPPALDALDAVIDSWRRRLWPEPR